VREWLQSHQFAAERGRVLVLPGAGGAIAAAVAGLGALESADRLTVWHAAALVDRLPPGDWRAEQVLAPEAATALALGWCLGSYRMTRYRGVAAAPRPRLLPPATADVAHALRLGAACAMARDLINTPANDMGPAELADVAADLARRHGAGFACTTGEALLAANYPLVHAVGRASARAPRLLDLRWGDEDRPRVTLVGKGVCFDTGGLDVKPASAMLLMKKDMGGAAVALGVARALMERDAPIRLRVIVPAVENAIGHDAFRPGDVLRSRRGLTVEVANTDAEGRLVLADALAEADSEHPDLLIDFATLTGAARTALGPDLPALFTPDDALAAQMLACGDAESDPAWRLPLWEPYDEELSSRVADLANVSSTAFAGAVFGALFLRRFVSPGRRWAHLDLYAWNPRDRPGRPVGAEAQSLRLVERLVRERCG
jgi:leucyl aminopeptidase